MRSVLLFVSILGATHAAPRVCYTSAALKVGPARLVTSTSTTTPTAGCTETITHLKTKYETRTPSTVITSTSTKFVTDSTTLVSTNTVSANTTITVSMASTTVTTISTTATAPTSTSIVPAPSGFYSVQESLNGSFWNGSFAGGPDFYQHKLKRDPDTAQKKSPRNLHAQSVQCVEIADTKCKNTVVVANIYTVTSTASGTRTLTKTQVSVSIVAVSATSTTNVHVTSSVTFTSYTTTVTLSTTTAIATSTPSATYYELCGTNNLADVYVNPANDYVSSIAYIYVPDYVTYHYLNVDNAYDCCAAGMILTGYGGTFELYEDEDSFNYCGLIGVEYPGYGQDYNEIGLYVNYTGGYSVVGNLPKGYIDTVYDY